jgi:signal transduction histidine kinase
VGAAVAVVAPLCAFGLEQALRPWVEHIPFVLFFFVVSMVASATGWVPGLLSVVVSALCGYLFLSSSPHADIAAGALVGSALFLPVAAIIAGFGALVRAGFQEREAAARELAAAVQVRDEFISVASHELKTPLTSLSLLVQHLTRREAPPAQADLPRLLSSIRRQTDRLGALVDGLLDVSRVTSGRLELQLEPLDLSELVHEVVARFQDETGEQGPVIRVQADGHAAGTWDRLRVEQIVTNLVSNAIKYGEGSPVDVHVHVHVRGSERDAEVVVRDRGMGIAPADHGRVFERFERGDHGSAQSGFGIGLWIVREIATALGGSVTLDSAPGQGAAFTVTLPVDGPRRG